MSEEHQGSNLPAVSIGERGIQLRTIDDMVHLARMVLKAGIAPKGMQDLSKICVALQLGAEVGIPPMQAVQNIAVINGRPTIWGDMGIALIQGSGLLERAASERFEGKPGEDSYAAVCELKRRGQEGNYIGRFSLAQAKKGGLLGKQTYKDWCPDMLMWRARWRAYRAGFADVLRGLTFRDVIEDYPPRDADFEEAAPRALSSLVSQDAGAEPTPEPTADIPAGEAAPKEGDAPSPEQVRAVRKVYELGVAEKAWSAKEFRESWICGKLGLMPATKTLESCWDAVADSLTAERVAELLREMQAAIDARGGEQPIGGMEPEEAAAAARDNPFMGWDDPPGDPEA